MWRKLAVLLLVAVAAILTGGTSAQASPQTTAETTLAAALCSAQPPVGGDYSLQVCIERTQGGVIGHVVVQVSAEHAPCIVRTGLQWSDGTISPPISVPCPSGAARFTIQLLGACCGTVRVVAAIQRTADGTVVLRAQSPWLTT